MTGNEPYFCDTNILVYADDPTAGTKQKTASELLTKGLGTGNLRLSAQVLSEYYVAVTRKIAEPLSAQSAKRRIELFALGRITIIDSTLVLSALSIMARHQTSYWDALILAGALASGSRILYSEDFQHGRIYESVKVINPFL
jgi:predicted nucleic acid-binding protein